MMLTDWSAVGDEQLYTPPELQRRQLTGRVFGHPTRPGGSRIRTSNIVSITGREVTTQNSVYILGNPSADYVEWCRETGCHVPTLDDPIKV